MSFEAAARGEEAQLMEWTLARALVMQLRELVTTEDDGPEGAMGPAWILAQVREMLGPAPESDALRAEIARLRLDVITAQGETQEALEQRDTLLRALARAAPWIERSFGAQELIDAVRAVGGDGWRSVHT